MTAGSPCDTSALAHHSFDRAGKLAVLLIQRLGVNALAFEHALKGALQAGSLVITELHLVPETEVIGQECLCHLPVILVAILVVQLVKLCAQPGYAHALVGNSLQIELVTASAQHQSASLVVGCHHDECLVGVLLIELKSHLHGIVHFDEFGDERHIVGMTEPVYLATLHHEEETVLSSLLLGKEVDGSTSNVGQREVTLLAVNGIGDTASIHLAGLL